MVEVIVSNWRLNSVGSEALDIRPYPCVMAKRRRDVCALPESGRLGKAGCSFVVRPLICNGWSALGSA